MSLSNVELLSIFTMPLGVDRYPGIKDAGKGEKLGFVSDQLPVV